MKVHFLFLLFPITLLLAAAVAETYTHRHEQQERQLLGSLFSNCEVCGRFLFFFRRRQHRKVDGPFCEDRCTVLRPRGFDDCGECLCKAQNAVLCPDRILAPDLTPCGNFGPENPQELCYCGTKAVIGEVGCGNLTRNMSALPDHCPYTPCDTDDDCPDICIDVGGPKSCFANLTEVPACDVIKDNRVCGNLCTNTTWQDEGEL